MNHKIKILILSCIMMCICLTFIMLNLNILLKNTESIMHMDDDMLKDITESEISTKEIITDICIDDEYVLEDEIEEEAFILQGEIAYNGDKKNSWNVKLGDFQGLTYYSQIDSRWRKKLYTSTGNKSQTIGTSGCAPTAAAMIVSSIKGTITPDTMAELFVEHGYRSPSNGTYWSANRAVADVFNIDYTETTNIDKAIRLLNDNNYIIVSVGNGLFTTGGHYIVIVGIDNNILKIYDPYLYSGKFETSTRKNKVKVVGNTVYCTVNNFRKYANYKNFFAYKNNNKSNYKSGQKVNIRKNIEIAYRDANRCMVDDGKRQFWVNNLNISGNYIVGTAVIAHNEGDNYIVEVNGYQFWINKKDII